MKFVEPYILLLIPVAVIFAVWGYVVLDKCKRKLLTAVLGNRACDPQAVHLSPFRRNLKRFLLVLTVILLIFAAARPYCRTVSRDVSVSGSDVLILFDVSNSMRATDLPPSRMAQAKYLLREVFQAFPHNRFGIGNSSLTIHYRRAVQMTDASGNETTARVASQYSVRFGNVLSDAQRAFIDRRKQVCISEF